MAQFAADLDVQTRSARATPWLMRATLVVSDPHDDLSALTRLAGLEPTALLRPGDVVLDAPVRSHQWRLDTNADARGALLEDHVESLADLIGDHINTLAAALREIDPAHVALEVTLQVADEAPDVRISADGVDILAQLRAGLRVRMIQEPDYGFLDEED